VIFVDRKDATATIEKADEAIRAHPAFKRVGPSHRMNPVDATTSSVILTTQLARSTSLWCLLSSRGSKCPRYLPAGARLCSQRRSLAARRRRIGSRLRGAFNRIERTSAVARVEGSRSRALHERRCVRNWLYRPRARAKERRVSQGAPLRPTDQCRKCD